MNQDQAQAALMAAQRQHLDPFVHRAFRELHPGTDFVPNWHIRAICQALEDVFHGRTRRLIITVPPRHLKSICTSVGFCAWALGLDPSLKIITSSYGGRLSVELGHQFRTVVSSPWYRGLFRNMQIDRRANRISEIKTTNGGGRFACARGGSVTGFGADILIVDDLLKADEARSETERQNAVDFFQGSLLSRLDDKQTGRVIVIQQRLHEADLAGELMMAGTYRQLNLPSIAEEPGEFDIGFGDRYYRKVGDILFPAREPMAVLDELRREMGPQKFGAQYQQNPVPDGDGLIRWEWFPTYEAAAPRSSYVKVVQSWDTGMSEAPDSDPSVCLTFGYRDGAWELLDVFRRRLNFPDLSEAMRRLQREWQADRVIVEKAGSGHGLLQHMRTQEHGRSTFVSHVPRVSKEERLRGQTPKLAEGLIRIPAEAPWISDFRRELMGFPYARHDDQADALSQFLEHISRRGSLLHPARDRQRRSMRRR